MNPETVKDIMVLFLFAIILIAAFFIWRNEISKEQRFLAEKKALIVTLNQFKESYSFVEELSTDNSLPEIEVGKCLIKLRSCGFESNLAHKVMTEFANSNWHSGGQMEDLENALMGVCQWMSKGVLMSVDKKQMIYRLPQIGFFFMGNDRNYGSVNERIEKLCTYLESKNS